MRSSSGLTGAVTVAGVAAALLLVKPAQADLVPLFQTATDWSAANGWSGQNGSTASTIPGAVFDSDGSTTNGVGNFTAPGGVGAPGSLYVSFGGNTYAAVAEISNEQTNPNFINVFDPGASGNNAAAYSGQVQLEYTIPSSMVAGGYFQIGIFLQYAGDGYYGPFLSTSQVPSSDGVNNTGQTQMIATIPYTITAGAFNGFGFGIFANTNAAAGGYFVVDNLSEITVPEPASLGFLATSATMLTLRRRRRA